MLSNAAAQSVRNAYQLAAQYGHAAPGQEHLLLSLTGDVDAVAALMACEADPRAIHREIDRLLPRLPQRPHGDDAVERTIQRAERFKPDAPCDGACLLLALLVQPGPPAMAQDVNPELARAANEVALAYVVTGDDRVDEASREGLRGLSMLLSQRTSVEPGDPVAIDLDRDELSVLTFLYWPITDSQPAPSPQAYVRLNHFMRSGGMILFDTRDGDVTGVGGPDMSQALQALAAPLEIPPLAPVPDDHVLTRSFYLLDDFPGRWQGNPVWLEAPPAGAEAAEGERERRPSAAGHHVAEVLRIIAKHHGALSPRQLERLQGWRDRVALKYDGMTLRNERTMQAILQPDKLTALLELPGVLMGAARRLRDEAPPQARSLAMRALAIAILTHLPLRLANLAGLDLDRNLYRPDPRRGAITELWIPPGETKGRKEIRMPIPAGLSALIREWIADYRPAIPGCRWLFPGYGRPGERIGHQGLRDAIKGAIATHVGVNMTPHQFRHLAATLFLEAFPDHYEELRQLLGHSSFEITRRYSGNVQGRAARRYQDLVMGRRSGGTPGGGQRDTRRGSRR